MAKTVKDEWGEMLITGWNKAGWMDKPMNVGNRIARLIGAEPESVAMGDTLSIKVYQALASALEMNKPRKVILSDSGNFPSDLYMAQGLCRTLGDGYTLKIVAPEEVLGVKVGVAARRQSPHGLIRRAKGAYKVAASICAMRFMRGSFLACGVSRRGDAAPELPVFVRVPPGCPESPPQVAPAFLWSAPLR
mgnify:CR=1 FL=1